MAPVLTRVLFIVVLLTWQHMQIQRAADHTAELISSHIVLQDDTCDESAHAVHGCCDEKVNPP